MSTEPIRKSSNPFSEQGVSKYPPVTPLVGQSEVYLRLEDLLEAMQEETRSCFRAIYGDWGIGKTRLAHEFVAEACDLSHGWLVKLPGKSIERKSLLKPLATGGILPIFTTFADILRSPEEGIDLRSALPKAVCVALGGLAEASGRDYQVRMANDLQAGIRKINSGFDFDELAYITHNQALSVDKRANEAFSYLQKNLQVNHEPVIRKILIIVDEVETAGEFTPANTAEERRVQEFPVEALDIKTFFSAMKEEAGQATLPNISFILLCSPGVRRVAYIEAIGRRVKDATLSKASGEDLKILIQSLQDDGYLTNYPGELSRAAFLAADRNFGWFSYIMHPVHRQAQEGHISGPDYTVLREVSGRIGKVFKPTLLDDLSVSAEFKDFLGRIVYHQVPATLEQLGIPAKARQQLLEYIDPYGLRIAGEIYPVRINGDTLIRELLETTKYKEEGTTSTRLIGEGSAPFEPRELLSCFSTYEGDEPETLLAFADSNEFANQVRFLVAEELSQQTTNTLHLIFEKHKLSGAPKMVAPTVAFLLKFNERWASAGTRAWLSDQIWERLDRQIREFNNSEVRKHICLGISKVLNEGNVVSQTINRISSAYISWKVSDTDPFNLTREGKLVVLYAVDSSSLIQDLSEINKNPMPVLVVFPSEDRLRDWRSEVVTTHRQELSRLVLPRVVNPGSREHDFLLRYSYRDEENGFPSNEVRDRGREQRREYEREWQKEMKGWFEQLENDGYLLRPLIPQNAKFIELRKAYGLLATGTTLEQIASQENGHALRQAVDNVIMNMANGSLKIFGDMSGKLTFPNVFARILDFLSTPLRSEQLGDRLFYQRITQGGFTSPRTVAPVIDQVLGLLEELGLVEKADGQFVTVDEQRLGSLLTKAVNQLGDFGTSPSNYVKDVRDLTDPFKLLAFKLNINEDQLKLLADELTSAQGRLPGLDLNAQKQVPARQEAFHHAAGIAREIRRSIDKIFREPVQTPPPIDALTVSQNLQQIAQDLDYTSYSVEYRIRFLKELQRMIEAERLKQQQEVKRLQNRLQGGLNKNSDGSAFPTRPIDLILDSAVKDLDDRDLVLPETLRTTDIPLGLRTYMMAGDLDKAFRRLSQYRLWLSQEEPNSYFNRFARSYNEWQATITSTTFLSQTWTAALNYFDGDPDKKRWLNSDLEKHIQAAVDHVSKFNSDFQADYPTPKLDDLAAEVKATSEEVANLTKNAKEAIEAGRNEIQQAIDKTTLSALLKLSERLGQPTRVNPQIIWNEALHINQHKKVDTLENQCKERGAELLGDENWFGLYVQIYRDIQSGIDGNSIIQKHGFEKIKTLHDKGAFILEVITDIEL